MKRAQDCWRNAVLSERATIQEAIQNLELNSMQIVLILDSQDKLIGTLSDGDIRRGLLRELDLLSPIESLIYRNPLVVTSGVHKDIVLQLMIVNKIRQIPIVNEEGSVLGLHVWDHLGFPVERNNMMVIMSGGRGTRMQPYTESCPKPMLEVAGKPMLEHIICQAKAEGFKDFVVSVNYLGHVIEDYFSNGENLDVRIQYLRETQPLGTAGSLSLLSSIPDLPLVVSNGDILTDIRYGELLNFHQWHEADATMAVRLYEWENPYGVVNMDGVVITDFYEKPVSRWHINAGIYVLSPTVLELLVHGEYCDMPTLFTRAKENGLKAIAYPMHEPWLDVGRPADLEQANRVKREKRVPDNG
jgi:dTDP-glucose pyrophosphorylase